MTIKEVKENVSNINYDISKLLNVDATLDQDSKDLLWIEINSRIDQLIDDTVKSFMLTFGFSGMIFDESERVNETYNLWLDQLNAIRKINVHYIVSEFFKRMKESLSNFSDSEYGADTFSIHNYDSDQEGN